MVKKVIFKNKKGIELLETYADTEEIKEMIEEIDFKNITIEIKEMTKEHKNTKIENVFIIFGL